VVGVRQTASEPSEIASLTVRYFKAVGPLVAALTIAACNGGSSTIPTNTASAPQWQAKHLARAACPQVVNRPACMVLISSVIRPQCSPSSGCGWVPSELQTRYGLTPYLGQGSGTDVAVIEVGDDSSAASDLSTYRSQFGLGTANLVKYNQNGQEGNYPDSCADYGWCLETALDMEMVSTSCPQCTIFLMEADDSISGLETAETSAVTLGATIVSNSWGCPGDWDCGDSNFPKYFDAKHVTYLGSTGDYAYDEIGGPAVLATVVAVGGTQLEKSGSTYSETAWDDAAGGCETDVARPKWQHNPHCKFRSVGDVSAEAGCSPGVAEYASQYGGWVDVCGTSVASPLVAGIFALAGNAARQDGGKTFWLAKHRDDLYDVCGKCLFSDYSYQGGWGSPNGIGAF
jgi:subtilase family serine protease